MFYKIKRFIRLLFNNEGLSHKYIFHESLIKLQNKFHNGEIVKHNKFLKRDCFLCGERNDFIKLFRTAAKFCFVECPNCSMVFMNPIPNNRALEAMYNSESMAINLHGTHIKDGVIPKQKEDLDYILKFLNHGRLLEIGCGGGGFLLNARKHFDVEGLEINKNHFSLGISEGLKLHNIYSSDFNPHYKFDVIALLQVIEHLSDPCSVISDAYRLLSNNGYIYVACPNFKSRSMEIFKERHRHVSTFGHINMYSPDTLIKQLENLGFHLINLETYHADIELHDLFYYYFYNKKFSHRMSNYNPTTYQIFSLMFSIFRKKYHSSIINSNQGSYIRAIFQKK